MQPREREEVQLKIFRLLRQLNQKFSSNLLVKFTFTLGDEFQGVLKKLELALDVVRFLQDNLIATFYCGIGIGEITTPIKRSSSEMDGPAFHYSRAALLRAKKEKMGIVIISSEEGVDNRLNILIQLILHITNKWTNTQKKIISYLHDHPDASRTEIAKHFKVSKQDISKTLSRAGWKPIRKAEIYIQNQLGGLGISQPQKVDLIKSIKKG